MVALRRWLLVSLLMWAVLHALHLALISNMLLWFLSLYLTKLSEYLCFSCVSIACDRLGFHLITPAFTLLVVKALPRLPINIESRYFSINSEYLLLLILLIYLYWTSARALNGGENAESQR